MYGISILGFYSIFASIITPIVIVLSTIWIFQIKNNTKNQVEQNKEIIELLKKE